MNGYGITQSDKRVLVQRETNLNLNTSLAHLVPSHFRDTKALLCSIECFHSRGLHLRKFIETKESVCIRKEFNSQRIGLGHQHGRRFIVLGHQYGRRDVM